MSMKLVFPGGDHPHVLLGPGVSRVGSDPQAHIVLDTPGVRPQHCQLHVGATGVMLEVPHGTPVGVNGRCVDGLIALRPGDSVTFDRVLARLASLDSVAAQGPAGDAGRVRADPGATTVRAVMPMYVLRGVTGGAFGRSYALERPQTIGRAPECDIRVNDPGLSRVHARLVPGDDGVEIEDLESTNGSFVNERRIARYKARIGDEIGFDTVRFRLTGSGACSTGNRVATPASAPPPSPARGLRVGFVAIGTAFVALAALGAHYL